MRTAVNEICQSSAAADIEDTNALGCVNLVSRKRKEIDTEFLNVHFQFADRLHGIGVEWNIVFLSNLANLCERLNSAVFVVDVHDGDKECRIPDCFTELRNANPSVSIHGEIGYLKPALLQILTGMQNGVVLHRRGDDMIPYASTLL